MPAFTPDGDGSAAIRYRGKLYRAINPIYAREPLSGRGAALYGGRFNPKGVPALYTSLTILTALREANQVGNLQPTTLVSYDADIERVFDSRNAAALDAQGMSPGSLADPGWRDAMRIHREGATQHFARRLIASGYRGLLVRSLAPGAGPDDFNLVLWEWGTAPASRLVLVDDENRLGR